MYDLQEVEEGQSFDDFLNDVEVDMDEFSVVGCDDSRQEEAVIVCSSGTTGLPKGVSISHYGLAFQTVILGRLVLSVEHTN